MNAKKILVLVIALCFSFTMAVSANGAQATDYSNPAHWLAVPETTDKQVDVFYLYPTAWQKQTPHEPNVCELDNPSMVRGSKLAFARQATAFEPTANVYAPFYRQADAAYCLSLTIGTFLFCHLWK